MIRWFLRKPGCESLRWVFTIAVLLGGMVNVEPSAHGQGGPISSQTQNRQGFGPSGSNIPNDVNAGHPQRHPRPNYYVNTTNDLVHISPPNIARPNATTLGLPLTPGLTDEPERKLPEVALTTEKTIETLTGGRTKTKWFTWLYACVLAAGVILAFYRRKTGLSFAGVGVVLLGSSYLFKSNVPSAANKSPVPAKVTPVMELSKSAHPIPDFDTFKERLASPYAFYRKQAVQAAPRLGKKTVPYLIAAELDDRSAEVRKLARSSLFQMRHSSDAASIWSNFQKDSERPSENKNEPLPAWALEQLRSPNLDFEGGTAVAKKLLADLLAQGCVRDENTQEIYRRKLFNWLDVKCRWQANPPKLYRDLEVELFQGKIDKKQFIRAVSERFVTCMVEAFDSNTAPNSETLSKFNLAKPDLSEFDLTPEALDRLERVWTKQIEKEWYFCPYVSGYSFSGSVSGMFHTSPLVTIAKVLAASGTDGEEFLAKELPKLRKAFFVVRCEVAPIFLRSASNKIRDSAKSIAQQSLEEIARAMKNSVQISDKIREQRDNLLLSLAAIGDKDALSAVMAIVKTSPDVEFDNFSRTMTTLGWGDIGFEILDEFWKTSEVGYLAAKRMMLQQAKEKKAGAYGILRIHPKLRENAAELYTQHFFRKSQSVEEALLRAIEMLMLQKDTGAKLDASRFAKTAIDDFLKTLPADGGQRQAIVERIIYEQLFVVHLEPYLIAALDESTCPRGREALLSIIFGARRTLGDEFGPPVARQTGSQHSAIQRAAYLVLQTLDSYDTATFAVLAKGVKNPDPIIRTTAMRALCRFQDRAALVLKEVTTSLKSDNAEERSAAGELLASMGPAAIPAISLLQSSPEFGQVAQTVRRNCTKD